MAWIQQSVISTSFTKAAGTTHVLGSALTAQVGDTIIVGTVIDNTGTGVPTVTSITKPAGETASWVKRGFSNGPNNTAAAGMITELWEIVTTVAWSSFTPTVTWSASAANKGANGLRFAGLGAFVGASNHQAAAGTGAASTITAGATVGGANPDLVVALLSSEGALSVPGATGFTSRSGAWSTGGSVATNLGLNIATAPGNGSVMSGQSNDTTADHAVVLAYWRAASVPTPVLSQTAYGFYADDDTLALHTPLAAQDTPVTANVTIADADMCVRIRVQETAGVAVPTTTDFLVQFEKNASGTWTNLTTATATVASFDSANFADGNAFTTRLTGGTGSASVGNASETGQVLNKPISASGHSELLFTLRFKKADLVNGDVIRFRVLMDGAVLGSYPQVPTVTVQVGGTTHQASGTVAVVSTARGNATITGAPPDVIPLSGLTGWYDADDPATFSFSSGTAVSQWRDKSGLGRHFAQPTAALQPSRSGTQNGRTTVVYDGADDYLDTAAFTQAQPVTVFLALKPVHTDLDQGWFSSVGGQFQSWIGNGTLSYYAGTVQSIAAITSDPQRWTLEFNGSSSKAYRDGTLLHSGDVGTTGTTTGWRTAERDLTTGYRLNGAVFEIIVYDRVLSAAERVQVDDYLVAKWITPPAGPVTYPASGTVAIVSTVSGDATLPITISPDRGAYPVMIRSTVSGSPIKTPLVAAGIVPIASASAGAVSLRAVVSGLVQISSAVPAPSLTVRAAVSGVVPIVSDSAGTVTARHIASGVTPIVSTAAGDATVIGGAVTWQAAGTVSIVSTASGAISSSQLTSGVAAIISDAAGALTARHVASGVTSIISAAVGNATIGGATSGTAAIVSTAAGAVTSRQGVSALTPIVSDAAGAVTAQHVASGTVAITSSVAGDATVIIGSVSYPAAGTVAIVSGSGGAVTASLPTAGVVPIVSTAVGTVTALHPVSGSTSIISTASGAVSLRASAAGVVAIVSTAAGTASTRLPVSGTTAIVSDSAGAVTAQHQVSGITPIVSTAAGAANPSGSSSGVIPIVSVAIGAVTATMNVSGRVDIISDASGSVTAQHPVSGSVPIVSTSAGAAAMQAVGAGVVAITSLVAGAVTSRQQVSGTAPIVSAASGQLLPASAAGTVAIVSTASGAISLRAMASGVVAVISTASGTVTARLPVSGVVAIVSGAAGAPAAGLSASGAVAIVSTSSGAVTATHSASGVIPIVTTTSGSTVPTGSVGGTVPIVTTASGAVTARLGVSARADVVSALSGAVTAIHAVSGVIAISSTASGEIERVNMAAAGVVPVISAASGSVTARHQVSGTVVIVSSVSGDAGGGSQVSGTVEIRSAASGAVSLTAAVSGLVQIASSAAGAVTRTTPISGSVAIVSSVSGLATKRGTAAGRVDAVTTVIGSVTATHQVSGTVVIVSGVIGAVTSSADLAWPECLGLTLTGPVLSLSAAAGQLQLRGFTYQLIVESEQPTLALIGKGPRSILRAEESC